MPRARGRSTTTWLAAIAILVVALVACATILDVDEPARRQTSALDAGDDSLAPIDDEEDDAGQGTVPDDAGCIGPGCPCGTDVDCRDSLYAKCVSGTCMACTTTPVDSCPPGRYCLQGTPNANPDAGESVFNECAPGCTNDNQCASPTPYCNAKVHQCVACRSKADCPIANQDCAPSGLCADKCDTDGGACGSTANNICCGGFCIDSQSDYLNCNGCNLACLTPQGAALACCAGACKNTLKDREHCGACGVKCVETNGMPKCGAGTCKWDCTKGFNHCTGVGENTGCETPTSADPLRCGGCANDCSTRVLNVAVPGIACVDSGCSYSGTCNPGFDDCNDRLNDGCECKDCGHKDQPCCTDGTPPCVTEHYCEAMTTCKKCKKNEAKCTAPEQCCSNKCENERCKP